ncbi:MAG: iron ABC transporter substrate-binding protein [Micrococcus sp.]|nr:iron ABC transporter substrate-binding protein [Micrococcus sp.]
MLASLPSALTTKVTTLTAVSAALLLGLTACSGGSTPGSGTSSPATATATSGSDAPATQDSDNKVVLYSGRDENLVQPILDDFTAETGIEVEVRYDKTAAMAAQLIEEGDASPADVFLAQDAGALGAVAKEGVLIPLDQDQLDPVDAAFRDNDGRWVGLTGRVRVLAYNEDAVSDADLPATVDELTEEQWKGRVGIAPTNASFQTFVTALRLVRGDEAAKTWLTEMAANDPQIREKNGEIMRDVNAGTLDAGLINHYYLYELAAEQGVPAEELAGKLHFFPDGDLGSLVNVSGIGLVGEQPDGDGAALIEYLLSAQAQTTFAEQTYEYPLVDGVDAPEGLPTLDELDTPDVNLNDLDDLQTTVTMIQESGLL